MMYKDSMKIAAVGTRGFPHVQGGVEKHCECLYPRIAQRGVDVVVFTRHAYVDSSLKTHQGVRLISLSHPKNKFLEAFIHTYKAVWAARSIRPNILHFHAIGPAFFVPLARLLGFKVVMTHHGPDYRRKKWNKLAKLFLRLSENLGVRWANQVICVSESIAHEVRDRAGRAPVVIPNGVQLSQVSKSFGILKTYGLEKRKYILAVGRLVPEKGFHDLIQAHERVSDGWKLVIVGDADHTDAYSRELQINGRNNPDVIMTGALNGLPLQELYSHAGLFVLPSYYEGLPIVLLEALGYGLSCMASDIPANKNMKLAEARYFPVGDIEALSEKIRYFKERPLADQDVIKQREHMFREHNWDKVSEATLKVYQQVIAQ